MAEKYEVVGKIGEGAYSDVYKVKDRVSSTCQSIEKKHNQRNTKVETHISVECFPKTCIEW